MRDHALDALLEPLVHPGADPEAVALAVLEALSEGERRRLLHDALLVRAKRAVAARTPRAPRMVPPRPQEPSPVRIDAPVTPVRSQAPTSAKVAGIRNWWSDFLAESVILGATSKRVGDCTAADMDVLARQRHAAAQRVAKQAQGLAALAQIMREDGARTVKDLPQQRAQRVLSR